MDNNNNNNRTPSAVQPQLTAEAASQFHEGINIILSRWTALQMAVVNGWGGPHSLQKPQQLAVELFSLLTQSKKKVYIDDVEDMLDEFMLSFNTEIADGSIEEIAENLMVMHEECSEGNYNSIKKLKEADPPSGVASCIKQANSDDDEDDDDQILEDDDSSEMVVDAPKSQSNSNGKDMMVDEPIAKESAQTEDGWTVVGSRRKSGKRN